MAVCQSVFPLKVRTAGNECGEHVLFVREVPMCAYNLFGFVSKLPADILGDNHVSASVRGAVIQFFWNLSSFPC